jgi:hypothetical protein
MRQHRITRMTWRTCIGVLAINARIGLSFIVCSVQSVAVSSRDP